MPGQEGTAAIAGHRTTYGAPFGPLDGLAKGDVIQLTTFQGSFDYIVDQDPFAVDPHDFSVLDAVPDPENPGHFEPRLTLSTCNPKFSASQRLIVQAHLKLAPQQIALPPQVRTTPKAHLGDADLSGDVTAEDPDDHLGLHRRGRRRVVVAPLPPPPALDHVARRRGSLRRRPLRLLHVPRARTPVELLIDARPSRRTGRRGSRHSAESRRARVTPSSFGCLVPRVQTCGAHYG